MFFRKNQLEGVKVKLTSSFFLCGSVQNPVTPSLFYKKLSVLLKFYLIMSNTLEGVK